MTLQASLVDIDILIAAGGAVADRLAGLGQLDPRVVTPSQLGRLSNLVKWASSSSRAVDVTSGITTIRKRPPRAGIPWAGQRMATWATSMQRGGFS